jgi:hypothetical protein
LKQPPSSHQAVEFVDQMIAAAVVAVLASAAAAAAQQTALSAHFDAAAGGFKIEHAFNENADAYARYAARSLNTQQNE